MRILLDTHIFLWSITNDRKLSKTAKSILSNATEVYVSSASIWEAAIKIKLGKLDANIQDLVNAISESGFLELAVNAQHALGLLELPDLHRDPFDRILISQAINEPLHLITVDGMLKRYSDLVELV